MKLEHEGVILWLTCSGCIFHCCIPAGQWWTGQRCAPPSCHADIGSLLERSKSICPSAAPPRIPLSLLSPQGGPPPPVPLSFSSTSAASFPPPLLQRPVFQFRYALPTCDVPPHNAVALTVVHLAPNHPTDLPSVSATVVTSPPSCNLPQNVLQPAATRAGLPPIPLRLAAAASAVFSLQTQKSRAASQQQRQLGEPAAGGSGGRPVATAKGSHAATHHPGLLWRSQ